jgi:hypothetical protein
MGVTRGNLKPIVKGSGRYHYIRWNVENLAEQLSEKRETGKVCERLSPFAGIACQKEGGLL